MAHATPYALFKAAMVAKLEGRAGLSGVKVSYQAPEDVSDVRADGSWESIHFNEAEGTSENVILCGGHLHFDYEYVQTAIVQVLRPDSLGTQQAADERVEEILYEVFAELARQQEWDLADLGLDDFMPFQATPLSVRRRTGILTSPGHGAGVEVGIRVYARRSFI
jgi:hypothetical protein